MKVISDAIEARDLGAVFAALFVEGPDGTPIVRPGFRQESELWDFKQGLPGVRAENDRAWAEVAANVAAFHNNSGGVLCFGITDHQFTFAGTRDHLDAKKFNDQLFRYLGDQVWIDFTRAFIHQDQRYLGIALVPKRGMNPLRFRADAPPDKHGDRIFSAGDLAIREGDQTRILRGADADTYLAKHRLPSADARFQVDVPAARILRADYDEFIDRDELCRQVEEGLRDDRTFVVTLTGIGGTGKTALACWAVMRAYQAGQFSHFISMSAKDRALTHAGIAAVESTMGSLDDLLDQVLEVLAFDEYTECEVEEKEAVVRQLLPETTALLFVDNLETIDDKRVIQFLETLPKPAKAITTSRTAIVKRAVFPVPVGPLSVNEAVAFLDLHARRRGKEQIRRASKPEKERIVRACSFVPLAIEWIIGNSPDLSVALSYADTLVGSKATDDELLEFCFRRIHSGLPDLTKAVMGALALSDRPQMLEAISAACGISIELIETALSELEDQSLLERVWDQKIHDYAFRMLPITRRFAYRELQQRAGDETSMRRRLSEWYEGRDVPEQNRALIVAARRGKTDPDIALVEVAIDFRRQGKVADAKRYFLQAIDRNPTSWRAHREFAELLRDSGSTTEALEHYEIAARHCPAHGGDRARIYREWGMITRSAGVAGAQERAAELFETALKETPNDPIVQHALASCCLKLSQFGKAQLILERLVASKSPETRARSYPLLEECYEKRSDRIRLQELRDRIGVDREAAAANLASRRTTKRSSQSFRSATAPPDDRSRRR